MKGYQQGIRFIIVGIVSNLLLYLLFLMLTALGLGHKSAMTLLYLVGVAQTFVLNKHWTFEFHAPIRSSLGRYLTVYASGYLVNLSLLAIFVDNLGLPHALVQGVTIPLLALGLFWAQRYWVFTGGGFPRRGSLTTPRALGYGDDTLQ